MWNNQNMADRALPSGLITFLFTDIEGSTRLLRALGEGYVDLFDLHNRLLRAVWNEHGGVEVSTEGDSFLVAFSDADAAITAAAAAQRVLGETDWPKDAEVKVRMGIHSGLAAPRGDSYVALAVHQAARVIQPGHGGQILVSEDTVFLSSEELRPALRPLGRYRLRDFSRPVRLYQVIGAGLGEHFPALRATPADRHNIVGRPTATIGRAELIRQLAHQVVPRQTLTLTGPGGVGKSRVASDLGLAIAPDWQDGIWLVELAAIVEPDLVPAAVADAVGAPGHPTGARTDDVLEHLETRKAVVILDNCEHLVEACRSLISRLRASCPQVAVITTSRERLHVPGERSWRVEPLPVPEEAAAPGTILDSPAVTLFKERGARIRPGFEVDQSNADAIASIVRHLDGLPLLIELAAAHLAARSPAEIHRGIEEGFRYLRSRDPEMPERHRTVEGLLSWSYQLLSGEEQAAFRRLAVFASDFSQEAAGAAVGAEDDIDDILLSLVDRSLVEPQFGSDDTRYRLLETVRRYGRQRLDESDETDQVTARLGGFFLDRLGPWLPADRRWVGDVAVELDNLRALIPLLADRRSELAQGVACTIGRYHDAAQSYQEGIDELERLGAALVEPSATRVAMLATLSYLYLRTGRVERAEEVLAEARDLHSVYGSPEWDDVAIERTDGEITRRRGDLTGAIQIARDTLERPISDRARSRMYNLLGTTSAALGDLETAFDACRRELELNERLGYDGYVASAHGNLAEVALRLGDMPEAARHQRSSLSLAVAHGTPALVAFSLIVAARIAGWREEWATAVQLHTTAEAQLEEIGLVLYEDDRTESDALLDSARSNLGDETYEDARRHIPPLPDAIQMADEVLASAEQLV
jgi:predicted ATPase/class 3 adenylate cyclase